MDRCHRIGQQRPVLVFRLVTAHSVEGKMLKRAGDKMALERIVIKKGAFQDLGSSSSGGKDNAGKQV
jgi:ATP-dependent DNA helicase